jgi:hypothetical protein
MRVDIAVPRDSFPKVMFFNRFKIELVEGMIVCQFAFVANNGAIYNSYSCAINKTVAAENKKNLLEYMGRLPVKREPFVPFATPFAWNGTEVADIINMAHKGDGAEIVFSIFSAWGATMSARDNTQIKAQPLALLRCELKTQRQFIEELYA